MNEVEKTLKKLSPSLRKSLLHFAEHGTFTAATPFKSRHKLVTLGLVEHLNYGRCPTCLSTPDGENTVAVLATLGKDVVKALAPDLEIHVTDPYLWWVPDTEEAPKWPCAGCGRKEWQQLGARFWCGNCGTIQYEDDGGLHVVMPELVAEATNAKERFRPPSEDRPST